MKKRLFISLGKLLLFISLLTAIIFTVKRLVLSGLKEKDIFDTLYQTKKKSERRFYFTGTSRMKCAVNDSLLNDQGSNNRFFNAGLGYGTFISNVVLANKLMSSIDSPVIFIELSVANGRMPYTFSLVSEPANTVSSMWPLLRKTNFTDVYHIYGPFAEHYFIDYINLKPYLKLYKSNFMLADFFGQLKKYNVLQYNPQSFLTESEIKNAGFKNVIVPESYRTIIKELITKAHETNSHIFFVLPISISNAEEKKRLLDIYSIIPEKNKLSYSSSFLKKISDPAYLADEIHLNIKGADIYTNYIKEVINERFGSFE